MLEYMAALAIGQHFLENIHYNCQLPEFGLIFDDKLHKSLLDDYDKLFVIKDIELDKIDALVDNIKKSERRHVLFDGFFQRFELYRDVDFYRNNIFIRQPLDIEDFTEDEIVINIRTNEILSGSFAPYPLIPVRFYKDLIQHTGYLPVFIGQLSDCEYIRQIKSTFPNARMIPSAGPLTDFNRLRYAKKICIAVSTFSWLAAWLSEALEIHYPILGFFHPFCLPKGMHGLGGVDLTPVNDSRYCFHLFPILNAEPETKYLDFTSTINPISKAVSKNFAKELCRKAQIAPEEISSMDFPAYFKSYIDAAWSVSHGEYGSAREHYMDIGRLHGYSMHKKKLKRPKLENIAFKKPATQSSVCPWSKYPSCEKDAAGAVDGLLDGDYSFHTETEDNPWWRVDLDGCFWISEIWVFNRTEPDFTAKRASKIAIDIASTEDYYTEVFRYESEISFGGSDGNPLIFRPLSPILGNFVRLRLLQRECLHLEQVEVYGTL